MGNKTHTKITRVTETYDENGKLRETVTETEEITEEETTPPVNPYTHPWITTINNSGFSPSTDYNVLGEKIKQFRDRYLSD